MIIWQAIGYCLGVGFRETLHGFCILQLVQGSGYIEIGCHWRSPYKQSRDEGALKKLLISIHQMYDIVWGSFFFLSSDVNNFLTLLMALFILFYFIFPFGYPFFWVVLVTVKIVNLVQKLPFPSSTLCYEKLYKVRNFNSGICCYGFCSRFGKHVPIIHLPWWGRWKLKWVSF